MSSNLERFEGDLKRLIELGTALHLSIRAQYSEAFREMLAKEGGSEKLPSVRREYQTWYSESLVVLKQLLPDRVADFIRHYEKPKNRREINSENYRIEDYLQGLQLTRGFDKEKVVDGDAAIPHLEQQLQMLKAAERRFQSSLFEIRQIVQADVFDSELDQAKALLKAKFARAAGALAGVVLEGHLAQVARDHSLTIRKKNPGIADLNELLRNSGVVDVPGWRFIQHLADVRNLCDHRRDDEPTGDQVSDLIAGVSKVIKTVH